MAWELTGNAGTDPTKDFLGTTDGQPLVLKVNGVEHVRLDTGGNVGFGTEQPADPIHIASNTGDAKIRFEAASGPGFRSYSLGTAVNDWSFHLRDETGGYDLLAALWWNSNIIIGTPGSHVGIGVGAPADKLHIYSASGAANVRVEANNGAGGFRAYSLGTTTADFNLHLRDETANKDILTVSWTTGNVGIGTPTPQETLSVAGLIATQGVRFPDGSVQHTVQPTQGPQGMPGQPGGRGLPGPPGHPVSTSAVCGITPCALACGNAIGLPQTGPCRIGSDTGQCETQASNEYCCVCRP